MVVMDNKAQISIEYLTMLAIGLLLAGVVLILVLNLFTLKDAVVNSIHSVRNRVLQV